MLPTRDLAANKIVEHEECISCKSIRKRKKIIIIAKLNPNCWNFKFRLGKKEPLN